jgi:F0F1-type ATP synthase membrane subunit c/vacuolar-type H+-ATPase subunit K
MKKIFWPGLLAGLAMIAIGIVINLIMNAAFPGLKVEYETSGFFRPWSDPLMWLFFAQPIALGWILAWVWNYVKVFFKAPRVVCRGVRFGLVYGLFSLPGMIISYSTFTVSLGMVIGWTVSGLIQGIIAGLILAKMNK